MTEMNAAASVGDPIPNFDLPASGGTRILLAGLLGKPFVLYFYPKADTSGCTQEAREFEAEIAAAGRKAIKVVGISKDPIKAVDAFAKKYGLTYPLATDEPGALLEALGVWVQKSMYGRIYMGIERTTFLVDAEGRIAAIWRKVKVPGHAAAVFKTATTAV